MIEKAKKLEDIQLLGANLVTNDKWIELFIARGSDLKSFKVEWLDASFDDQAVEALSTFCANITRLKLERCKRIGVDAIDAIARMKNLEHLTLRYHKEVPQSNLVTMIEQLGGNLRTLCLENFLNIEASLKDDDDAEPSSQTDMSDAILETIHDTCTVLEKFRFTENNECTDQGYVNLFTDWQNTPLRYIDLNSNRDIDNANPDGPEENPIGLGSAGFVAMMKHSGSRLEYLDVSSCRHITWETFADVFAAENTYPFLEEVNLSFCSVVDTEIVARIFRYCPKIKKVVTFGCFEVRDVEVPRGIVLIGAPRAEEALEQFGERVMDFQKDLQEQIRRDNERVSGRIIPMMA